MRREHQIKAKYLELDEVNAKLRHIKKEKS